MRQVFNHSGVTVFICHVRWLTNVDPKFVHRNVDITLLKLPGLGGKTEQWTVTHTSLTFEFVHIYQVTVSFSTWCVAWTKLDYAKWYLNSQVTIKLLKTFKLPGPVVTGLKTYCFELVLWDTALVGSFLKEHFLVSLWDLCQRKIGGNLSSYWVVLQFRKPSRAEVLDMQTACHPKTGWMIVYLIE